MMLVVPDNTLRRRGILGWHLDILNLWCWQSWWRWRKQLNPSSILRPYRGRVMNAGWARRRRSTRRRRCLTPQPAPAATRTGTGTATALRRERAGTSRPFVSPPACILLLNPNPCGPCLNTPIHRGVKVRRRCYEIFRPSDDRTIEVESELLKRALERRRTGLDVDGELELRGTVGRHRRALSELYVSRKEPEVVVS